MLLAVVAAILAGCAADAGPYGYMTADQCLSDRQCRREWRAEKRAERRANHIRHVRRRHVHTAGWEGRRDYRSLCAGVVTATGEKANSQENAEIFAMRIWRGQVSFRYGEVYTDFHRAVGPNGEKNPQIHCAPVGIADTFTGKIREKWLGVTYWRCELSARPCRGRPETVERD
jgi:hypothetical protein